MAVGFRNGFIWYDFQLTVGSKKESQPGRYSVQPLPPLEKGELAVIPGMGRVRVLREDVATFEHSRKLGRQICLGLLAVEVELAGDKGKKLICMSCRNDGVIEEISIK